MEFWFWMVLAVLVILVLVLCWKIILMRKSAREIEAALEKILETETNALITISSREHCMRSLAAGINQQLRILHRERQRFQSGDRRLKEAVTNISHDIRTPLTAICGYLDLLETEGLPENTTRYLKIIRNRSEILKELTEEFFHYAVVTSRDLYAGKREDVIINHVLEECISGCYLELKERGITPEIQMPEGEVHRQLNRNALYRIYENLITNAVRYSDGDLRIHLTETGDTFFSNQAHGLTEVQAERLVERFYTVEDASGSTGLGLTVAKTLAEQMGGGIQVQYQDGIIEIRLRFL